MKILYVNDYYKPAYCYGGGTTAAAIRAEGLAELGLSVTVITTNANCKTALEVSLGVPHLINGVQVFYFERRTRFLNSFYSPGLGQKVKEITMHFDLVIAGSLWGYGNLVTVPECRRRNIPYVIPLHGQLNPWAFKNKIWKKWWYYHLFVRDHLQHAAVIYCTDSSEKDNLSRFHLKPPQVVLPYGINPEHFQKKIPGPSFREKYKIRPSSRVLLFSGRLVPIKRPDIAVKTLSALVEKGLDVELVFAGPDEVGLVNELEILAHSLHCRDRVYFVGLLDHEEMIQAYQASNLLLTPSEVQENFGLSTLEALASGLPVLASEGIPAAKTASEYGAACILPCDENAFIRKSEEILRHPELQIAMQNKARNLVMEQFDNRIISMKFLEQIMDIVKNGDVIARN